MSENEANVVKLPPDVKKQELKSEIAKLEEQLQEAQSKKTELLQNVNKQINNFLDENNCTLVAELDKKDLPGIVNTFLTNPNAGRISVSIQVVPKVS